MLGTDKKCAAKLTKKVQIKYQTAPSSRFSKQRGYYFETQTV
jgi:hypothetical protein